MEPFEPLLIWDLEDDPQGNYVHIVEEHGITQDEVWDVVSNPENSAGNVWLDTNGKVHCGDLGTRVGRPAHYLSRDGIRSPTAAGEKTQNAAKEINMIKHIHRKTSRSPEEQAKLNADRERYQREKPTPEQLLVDGGHDRFVRHGDLLMLHQLMAALKEERERQKISMAKLAAMTGIDQAALSRLENGKNTNPTFETMNRIAAALGKTIACSLKDAPSKREKTAAVST
jgi:DNA-binding Xre family transcriptional regulator